MSGLESKTDREQFEDGGSEENVARMKMPRHVLVNGIGLYIDGSESSKLLCKLARLKTGSLEVLYNWQLTSSDYETSVLPLVPRSRVPWTFVPASDGAFFGSPMLKRTLFVKNKDMCSASLVYSKESWLMFLSVPDEEKYDSHMFLLNPFTGERLNLPPAPNTVLVRVPKASFTLHDGRPDLVIFPCMNGRYIRVLLARPGDEKWEEHSTRVLSKHLGLWDCLLCGRSLYCFFDQGTRLMLFHVDRHDWSASYGNLDVGVYLLEFEGKVLAVDPPRSYVGDGDKWFVARELIIHQNKASFVRMEDMSLSCLSWFLGPTQSFCARMKGQKVYQFRVAPLSEQSRKKYCVYYHDMLKKKFKLLTTDAFSAGHCWIDLGGVLATRHRRTEA